MRNSLLLLMGLFCSLLSFAGNDDDSTKLLLEQLKMLDSIESKLHYKTGTVTLENGLATINIAPGFQFLDAKEARYVLEDL